MGTDFRILGELEVLQDGRRCDMGSLRQRSLLARLILRAGQPVSADRLLDELWPEEMPETARHTLHVYVSRLRAALGPDRDRLRRDAAGYRLCLQPHELDASRFERLAALGRTALSEGHADRARAMLGDALDEWRGPALLDFADEPFATADATRLDQLRWATIEDRMRADLELGRTGELAEELRELTLQQPFREVLWEQLMLALYRSGRQADALRAYAEARMRLVDDLGVEPGPSLRLMQERILAQDPALSLAPTVEPRPSARPAAGNLPLQRTSFIGRERDLAIAGELLSSTRLLTLTGAPGSGKTRLALRLAADHAARFRDGVAFVGLAPTADERRLEEAIAGAVGVHAARDETPSDALHRTLRERELLIVLDNFEHLLPAAPRVGELLDGSPGVTILVTSREPLGIAGEQEFPVLPLAVPPTERLPDPSLVGAYDAVALFLSRARALDPTVRLDAENAPTIAAIAARLDGLPLALELAAGRLRLFSLHELLRHLEPRLPILASGSRDAVDRHRTLRDCIAWSYALLEPTEQTVFRRLGAFAGSFTPEAAAEVAQVPPETAWQTIDSLLSKHLLIRPVDAGEARFGMLETLREFALEMLVAEGERDAVLARHAEHVTRSAAGLEPELTSDEHDRAMARLALEADDVRAALRFCYERGEVDRGLRLASSIWRYWQRTGAMAEGREWLELLLARGSAHDAVRAKALVARASLAYWQADLDTTWASYREALECYRALGDREGEADVTLGMSMTATWRGDPARGAELASEARALFDRAGERARVGEALMSEGFALWQQRDYTAARPRWEAALEISRTTGNETMAVTQLAGLAGIESQAGDRDEARRMALEALSRARALQNIALCAWMLDLVAAFVATDEPAHAVRLAAAAEASRRAAGGGMRIEDLHIESARAVAARSLTPQALDEAWAEGRATSLDQAIESALARGGHADGVSDPAVVARRSPRSTSGDQSRAPTTDPSSDPAVGAAPSTASSSSSPRR